MRKNAVKYTLIILALVMICGCLTKPGTLPPGPDTDKAALEKTAPALRDYREPLTGPVSLEEAMSRAVKYGFEARLRQMRSGLSGPPPFSDDEALYKMLQSAGYGQGDSADPAFSEQKFRSLAYPAGDTTDGLTTVWNLLDFGLVYATDRQGNAAPTRQKVLHNIFREVRRSYYGAVSAEILQKETEALLGKTRDYLRHYREELARSSGPSREELEKQRQLIEMVRFLWDLSQKMNGAKAKLALLMGISPGTPFQISGTDRSAENPVPPNKSMMDMELLTLLYRTELQSAGDRGGLGVYETRKGVQTLRQDIDFDAAYDSRNPFAQVKAWQDAGREIARQLFSLSPVPAASAPNALYTRRLTLNMAVVAQLHLAMQQYALSAEEYRLSRDLADVNRKLESADTRGVSQAGMNEADGFSRIRKDADTLMARMRYYYAFAEMENAGAAFYQSVGIVSMPENMMTMSVSSLADTLKTTFHNLPGQLRQAQPPLFADTAENTARADSPAPAAPSPPETEKSGYEKMAEKLFPAAPEPEKTDKEINVVTTDVSEAANEDRQPVREITVFRDVVNIHFGPSLESPVKGQGLIGENYRLLGWARNGWLKIEMGDRSPGWIPTKYVRPVETKDKVGSSPKTDNKKRKTTGPEPAGKSVRTKVRANVRSAPSLESPVIYIEDMGISLPLLSTVGEWYKVRTARGEGWLHKSVLKIQ